MVKFFTLLGKILFRMGLFLILCVLALIITLTLIPYLNVCKTEELAIRGDSHSQCQLGFLYTRQEIESYTSGIKERDLSKAIYWYQKSAGQGNGLACYGLAKLYEQDNNRISNSLALKWLIKGAKFGDRHSVSKLSRVYADGLLGQAVNPRKSQYWQQIRYTMP